MTHSVFSNNSYTNTNYFFQKNAQGDIIKIYNASGTLIVKYTYDAYGNILSITDGNGNAITSSSHIAKINPFRYRGYYYDEESGLYYLNSRYYDPVTCRFINADGQLNDGLLGNNMFAYCGNAPVSFQMSCVSPNGSNGSIAVFISVVSKFGNGNAGNEVITSGNTSSGSFWNGIFGHVSSVSATQKIWDGNILLLINISYSQTVSKANREKPIFYSYYDQNKFTTSVGIGINLGDWLGVKLGVSGGFSDWSFIWTGQNSPFDVRASIQITPWIMVNVSAGLGGVTVSGSYKDRSGVLHNVSVNVSPIGVLVTAFAYWAQMHGIPADWIPLPI